MNNNKNVCKKKREKPKEKEGVRLTTALGKTFLHSIWMLAIFPIHRVCSPRRPLIDRLIFNRECLECVHNFLYESCLLSGHLLFLRAFNKLEHRQTAKGSIRTKKIVWWRPNELTWEPKLKIDNFIGLWN